MQDIASVVFGRKPDMNKRQLYLEASRQLAQDEERYSCIAIGRLTSSYITTLTEYIDEVKAYCSVFDDNEQFRSFVNLVENSEDPQNLRVIMTSLMAVCWQDFQ